MRQTIGQKSPLAPPPPKSPPPPAKLSLDDEGLEGVLSNDGVLALGHDGDGSDDDC
jgi:hypothetical protein